MYGEFKARIDSVIEGYNTKTAVTFMRDDGKEDKVSFEEIGSFICNTEKKFSDMGLHRGDRVAIISPHSPWAVFTGMALAYAGITIVLIDVSLPQEEIEKLCIYSDVKAIFTITKVYELFTDDNILNKPCFNLEQGLEIVSFKKKLESCYEVEAKVASDEDVIGILYSSGTTGEMKGIMVTYESVLKAREVFVRLSGLEDYMTYLLVLPFNHIAGFTGAMTFFLTGCEIGFIEDVNASKLQKGLLQFQPYYFAMVPKVYEVMEQKIRAALHEKSAGAEKLIYMLFEVSKFSRKYLGLNLGKKLFKSITKQVFGENIFGIGTGASPCKDDTTEFFLNLGLEWANLYATTETSVPIVATGIFDKYPVGTVGNVTRHPEIEIRISNSDKTGVGEIMVKSELMMKGYFRRPDLTAEAFENGYFRTGDCGFIDKKGYLHITGRIKESIILQNGKKVSPSDVDDYYTEKGCNYDIASRGITKKNEQYDEIHMFIANKNYTEEERKEIVETFKKMSGDAPDMYKLSAIHYVEEIPRTSVGKVKRYLLDVCGKENDVTAVTLVMNEDSHDDISEYNKLIQIIKRLHAEENKEIKENVRLEELGFDSLELFSLSAEIEKATGVDISGQITGKLTLKELVETVKSENSRDVKDKDTTDYNLSNRYKKDINHAKHLAWLLNRCCKVNYIGLENITEEPCIFAANHSSHLDIMCIYQAIMKRCGNEKLYKVCCLAAEELVQQKGMEKTFHALGAIPVDRKGNATKAFAKLNKYIQENGYSAVIFPEGTRTRTGKLGTFSNGVASASIANNIPVIPIGISGTFTIWPATRKRPKFSLFRKIVTVKIGEPVYSTGKDVSEFTGVIREKIEGLLKEKRSMNRGKKYE